MKKTTLILLSTLGLLFCSNIAIMAQEATEEEALTVATNWISAIIDKKGSWGGAAQATVVEITPFSRQTNKVGYFCRVHPKGYIIVSLHKKMAPIKAYSARSDIDPFSEEGLVDVLKGNMERILGQIQETEQQQVKISKPTSLLENTLLEIDYQPAWKALEGGDLADIKAAQQARDDMEVVKSAAVEPANYQEGEVLLSSDWHQYAPYNNYCPDYGCTTTSNARALVGCVATAGAQLARYWHWPPYGEPIGVYADPYDWVNMPDAATTASTAEEQAAVAELSFEMGTASIMLYGCEESGATTSQLENVFEQYYRYSSTFNVGGAERVDRGSYSAFGWFDALKNQFNENRPVIYRIPEHAIVGDGWQTIGAINQYHMNYGWHGPASDTWYTIDTLAPFPLFEEFMIKDIIPSTYLISLSGNYPRESFPYRYIYKDTIGGNGTFSGGQFIQFLPGTSIKSVGGPVLFTNSNSSNTHLFSRGDVSRGIVMPAAATSGAIKMYPNGGIRIF